MHDFNCTKADDMNFELMSERTRYLKENPKGVSEMCRIMEDMRNESLNEGIQEEKRMTVIRMLTDGIFRASPRRSKKTESRINFLNKHRSGI